MNQCNFMGYVAQDPELRTTTSGIAVCQFDLAIPRRKKSGDQPLEYDYVTIAAWRERAEMCMKYVTKGTKILVSTSLRTSTYEDNNQVKRKRFTFDLNDLDFCERKQDQGQAHAPQYAENSIAKAIGNAENATAHETNVSASTVRLTEAAEATISFPVNNSRPSIEKPLNDARSGERGFEELGENDPLPF